MWTIYSPSLKVNKYYLTEAYVDTAERTSVKAKKKHLMPQRRVFRVGISNLESGGVNEGTGKDKPNTRRKPIEPRKFKKRVINEDGTITYNLVSKKNGKEYKVTYDRDGYPIFSGKYQSELPEFLYLKSDSKQFRHLTKELVQKIEEEPELAKKFTEKELKLIKKGKVPKTLTWYHHQDVERYLGIKFPQDYKECVKLFNDGYPEPDVFNVDEDNDIVFSCLLSFTNEEANILEVNDIASGYLPEGIFPFAEDQFGNLICFDYRQDKESPIIIFYDHETENEENKFLRICDTFPELIEGLHEDDE